MNRHDDPLRGLGPQARRTFLRQLAALGAGVAPSALPLATLLAASSQVAAQTAGGYKALVCVFLAGGNDSFNTVLDTQAGPWAAYQQVRNQAPDSLALMPVGTTADRSATASVPARLGGVRPLAISGASLALHPSLVKLAQIHDTRRRLAIVANVGPLVRPTTKAQYAMPTHARPAKLFSHNDQQNWWQALSPEGARSGWGGRIADALMAGSPQATFTSVSISGASVWLAGEQVRQYQLSSNGAIRIGGSGSTLFGSAAALGTMKRVMTGTRSDGSRRVSGLLALDHADVVERSINAEATLSGALAPAGTAPWGTPVSGTATYAADADPLLRWTHPLTGASAANGLARQLQMVARCVQAAPALGITRQVFFVNLGGFDTHDGQNRRHAELMAQLDHGLDYFDTVLAAMGQSANVTTFTASDFGRACTSNGDGTDHGWGAHHLVMGGAVRAGLHGRWPTLGVKNVANNDFDSSPDQLRNGALLPTSSVDQLGATLATWMGVGAGDLAGLFPNLGNFDATVRNLGFMA
ncbi:DUF1501 domain-containing protein [Leptothrix discophora]|uniref:DUF1501 domain-containing protein n=1 Tax=Leptothrix discophora TaxID=89 RepID=A0ABT9G269_LEPDI|nr:DUF1501 domain-containing protein [Leptothrix discophora]MDP4300506.1 DUF1501 domain-containing protein [Leptothrix discophora]